MKSFWRKSRIRFYLVPVLISISIITTSASPFLVQSAAQSRSQTDSSQSQANLKLLSFKATAASGGVLLEWQTSFELNNLGFNLYREQNGERTLVNRSLIAGSALSAGAGNPLTAGRGYTLADSRGSINSSYYLEAIDLSGVKTTHGPFFPVQASTLSKQQQSVILSQLSQPSPSNDFGRGEPSTAFDNSSGSNTPSGDLNTQWTVAAQSGLKIQVKKSGWYRITQPELLAAGLSASADAGTLHLFRDGVEQAIRVSRSSGQLGQNDYIEFYAQALSNPFTDTRIYWLTSDTTQGKRMQVFSAVRPDTTDTPKPSTRPTPVPVQGIPQRPANGFYVPFAGQLFPPILRLPQARRDSIETETTREPVRPSHQEENENNQPPAAEAHTDATNASTSTDAPPVAHPKKKRVKTRKASVKKGSAQRNHFDVNAASASNPSFPYIIEHRNRSTYFGAVLNGDTENFFGEPILSSLPAAGIITLDVNNPDTTAQWEGTLEIAIQGVSNFPHQIGVTLNDLSLPPFTFYFRANFVVKIPISMSQLRAGANTLKLTTDSQSGVCLVDYVRLTFAHAYRADNNSLAYSAKSGQTVRIDGFTSSQVRIVDVTDPNNVQATNSWSGKGRHTFLAFTGGQINHADGITLNQPSQLNSTALGADLLVIGYSDFLSAVQPLVDLRRSQGLKVYVANVEDVYDEFSFGNRGPDAIHDFLNWAHGHWSQPPHFLLLVGCASVDPRNYLGIAFVDFVPTKLVDATFSEAASDDALADFDNDGLPEMAVGRLPGRSAAEISKMVSKIVNYTPGNQSQTAVMVADTNATGYDFEGENAEVAQLMPPSMTVKNVNYGSNTTGCTETNCATRDQINNAVNQGPMLVNYSGHGTLNAWTGSGIFRNQDALVLSNGNHLPVFIMMTCLTGYFNDPSTESISASLMRADNGGAVAAWASSGLTIPTGQQLMNKSLYQQLFSSNPPTIGDAVRNAKTSTDDIDVRHTWVLFGDPTMRVR
ncbi:MAG: hypothetical protein AUG51_25010 [Acidobacteria bacterium 13_1_20CM_3_53_8]|nr:MAG: hypothetical protein AUG51_25010 [Acidobacteria bacterium 13_1_20CM_3_53_8]